MMLRRAGDVGGELDRRLCNKWEVIVARSFDEIEAIRPVWEQMQRNESHPVVNADIDRYLCIVRTGSGDKRPYVMLAKRDGCPEAMTVAWIENRRFDLKLGYKTVFSPTLRSMSVVYGGIIGRPSPDICEALVGQLMNALRQQEADLVFLNHLRNDSNMSAVINSVPNLLCRDRFPLVDTHWQMPLPRSVDAFYDMLTAKQRRNLRRDRRRLEERVGDSVKVVQYRDVAELDDMIRLISEISSSSYQQALGVGFCDDEQTHSLLRQSASSGWLRGYVLYAGDSPLAFEIGTVYGNVYFADHAGFNAHWKSYGPGTMLQLKIFEELISDSTVRVYDFGFGHAPYKKKYGRISWPETSVCIFAPRIYPIFVNQAKSFVSLSSKGLTYLMNKTGISQSLKRYWRNLLWKKEQKG